MLYFTSISAANAALFEQFTRVCKDLLMKSGVDPETIDYYYQDGVADGKNGSYCGPYMSCLISSRQPGSSEPHYHFAIYNLIGTPNLRVIFYDVMTKNGEATVEYITRQDELKQLTFEFAPIVQPGDDEPTLVMPFGYLSGIFAGFLQATSDLTKNPDYDPDGTMNQEG